MFIDKHHVLFNRREWESRPGLKQLRENPLFIPQMDRSIHEELHRECPPVPPLDYFCLQSLRKYVRPKGDTLSALDNLIIAIDKASSGDRFHDIQRSMAQLSIEAIELQKPYIKEGIINDFD